jgi:hypothetical protein
LLTREGFVKSIKSSVAGRRLAYYDVKLL